MNQKHIETVKETRLEVNNALGWPVSIRTSILKRKEDVLDIIKDYPEGIYVEDLRQEMSKRYGVVITPVNLVNFMGSLNTDDGPLEKVGYGMYKLKEVK